MREAEKRRRDLEVPKKDLLSIALRNDIRGGKSLNAEALRARILLSGNEQAVSDLDRIESLRRERYEKGLQERRRMTDKLVEAERSAAPPRSRRKPRQN